MPSVVILGSYTEQGIQHMKDLPQRLEAAKQAMQAAGGKMISFYLTMGEYDFISVMEVPDMETGARVALQIAAQGNIRTKSMYGFTEAEAASVVSGL
jgi:uncharacterized protein with GYD domain